MSNISITNVDQGAVFLEHGPAKDEVVNFAAEATYAEGTILGRLTANGKLTPFVPGAETGAEVPRYVLSYPVSRGDAGDVTARLPMSGVVNFDRLIVHADGDNSNLTEAHRDLLRQAGFVPADVKQLARLDNQ